MLARDLGGREQRRAAPGCDVKDAIARLHPRELDESAAEPAEDGRADPIVFPRSPAKDAGPKAFHRIGSRSIAEPLVSLSVGPVGHDELAAQASCTSEWLCLHALRTGASHSSAAEYNRSSLAA